MNQQTVEKQQKVSTFTFQGNTFIETNFLSEVDLVNDVGQAQTAQWYNHQAAFPLLVKPKVDTRVEVQTTTKSANVLWSAFQQVKIFDQKTKTYLDKPHAICRICNDGEVLPGDSKSLFDHLQSKAAEPMPKRSGESTACSSFIERDIDGKTVKRLYLSDPDRASHEMRKAHWILFEAAQRSKSTEKDEQYIPSQTPLPWVSLKKEKVWEIDLANAIWIANDARSFRTCLSKSFREREEFLFRTLASGVQYTQPSAYRLTVALVSLYEHVLKLVQARIRNSLKLFQVANIPVVTVQMDGWKSSKRQELLMVRVCLLEPVGSSFPTFMPREFSLCTSLLKGNDNSQLTSRVIEKHICSLLHEFGIHCRDRDGASSNILGATAGNGSFSGAQELSMIHRQICTAHTLDNCLKWALGLPSRKNPLMGSFLKAFLSVISLMRTRKVRERLDREAMRQEIQRAEVSKVSETRWNVVFLAAVQALRMKPIIEGVLADVTAIFKQKPWVLSASMNERERWKEIGHNWGNHFVTLGQLTVPLEEVFVTTQHLQDAQRNLTDAFIHVLRLRMQVWRWLNAMGIFHPSQDASAVNFAGELMKAFSLRSTLLEMMTRPLQNELILVDKPLTLSEMDEVERLTTAYCAKQEAMDVSLQLAEEMLKKNAPKDNVDAEMANWEKLKSERDLIETKLDSKEGYQVHGSAFHVQRFKDANECSAPSLNTLSEPKASPELKAFLLRLAYEVERSFFGEDLRENEIFKLAMTNHGLDTKDNDRENTSLLSPFVIASVLLDPVGAILLFNAVGHYSKCFSDAIHLLEGFQKRTPTAAGEPQVSAEQLSAFAKMKAETRRGRKRVDFTQSKESGGNKRRKALHQPQDGDSHRHTAATFPQQTHAGRENPRFSAWDDLNKYLQKVQRAAFALLRAEGDDGPVNTEFGELNDLACRSSSCMERMLRFWNMEPASELRTVALSITNFRCSSASVERPASFASLVDTKKRYRLSAKMFEILTFLGSNRDILREISHDIGRVEKLPIAKVQTLMTSNNTSEAEAEGDAGTRTALMNLVEVDGADESDAKEVNGANDFWFEESFDEEEMVPEAKSAEEETDEEDTEKAYVQTLLAMHDFEGSTESGADAFSLCAALLRGPPTFVHML